MFNEIILTNIISYVLVTNYYQIFMYSYNILQEQKLSNNIQKRGALYALQTICSHFGEHLQSKLPRLIEIVYNSIKNIKFPENDPSKFYESL